MDSIIANEIRRGMVVKLEENYFVVVDTHHLTPGNWRAYVQLKLRNMKTESIVEKRLRSTEKIEVAYLDRKEAEYLYDDAQGYWFMDAQTFEQFSLSKELVGESMSYVKHNSKVIVTSLESRPIAIELPTSVILEVKETEPGVRGDTATNVTKKAVLETGLEVKVPLHINAGDSVKIDTRSGEFLGRSN